MTSVQFDISNAGGVRRVSEIDLFEDLSLGFRLDSESDLMSLLSDCTTEFCHSKSCPLILSPLAGMIADEFEQGSALELSGGIDSRLILALGFAGGQRPQFAFTLGEESDPDVIVAKQLAATLGFRHRAIAVRLEAGQILTDARTFVEKSGFICNAAAYGWLPSLFRQLANDRDRQIGGVGGEIAETFYSSPIDALMRRFRCVRLWKKLRLNVPGVNVGCLFRAWKTQVLETKSLSRLEMALGDSSTSWDAQLDRLYRDVRMPMWALPCLRASAYWYQPVMPFITTNYVKWAEQLSVDERRDRCAQRSLLRALDPENAAISFSSEYTSDLSSQPRRGKTGQKIWRSIDRIASRRRPASLMMRSTAVALAAERAVVDTISHLVLEEDLDLHPDGIQKVLSRPDFFAQEFGALLTCAWSRGL